MMTEPWLCKRGHRKDIVGVDNRNYCQQCKRELDKKYMAKRYENLMNRKVCKNGHVFEEVGRVSGGKCRECARLQSKAYYYRHRRPAKLANPNGFLNGKRIPNMRYMREKLGYSRAEFARRTGVSKDVLEGIEEGCRARPKNLRKILTFVAAEIERDKWERYA